MVSLVAGCGAGENRKDGARALIADAEPDGEANASKTTTAPEGTMVVESTVETAGAVKLSGGRVEACDGGSFRLNAYEKRILELHNETRKRRGLDPLCVNPSLTQAARAHSRDMIEEDYSAHTSPDGETLVERLTRFGYVTGGYGSWKVGGNVAFGNYSKGEPDHIFEGWMNSPPHRKNILEEEFDQIGIGTAEGTYKTYEESVMYTANFGVRRR